MDTDTLEFGFPLIAQEFIPGMEVGISFLALRGQIVAWTMQSWNNDKTLDFLSNSRWIAIVREIVERSNFHGLANIDAQIDHRDNGIKFVDFNPRFWETVTASMWRGTNFAELGIEAAMNGNAPTCSPAASGRFVTNGAFLRRVLSSKATLQDILDHDYRPICQNLADPLPPIISKLQRALGRQAPFTANIVE